MSQQVYVLGGRNAGIVYSPAPTAPGNDVTFQARLCASQGTGQTVDDEGNALKRADITSITRAIYEATGADPATPVATASLTVSAVVSDTLADDNLWTQDTTGRNFADTVSVFDSPSTIYRVVYTFTLSGGASIVLIYEHTTSAGGAS